MSGFHSNCSLARYLFLLIKFYWDTATFTVLRWQSCIVWTDTRWSPTPRLFNCLDLYKKGVLLSMAEYHYIAHANSEASFASTGQAIKLEIKQGEKGVQSL